MKALGVEDRRKRKFKNTTDSNHKYPVSPNLLNQKFLVKKKETARVYKNNYSVYSDAEISIFKWIETYNRNKRHSALNYKTINELELEINNQNLAA